MRLSAKGALLLLLLLPDESVHVLNWRREMLRILHPWLFLLEGWVGGRAGCGAEGLPQTLDFKETLGGGHK